MDLFSPLRLGVHLATDAVKLATIVPRFILHQLTSDDDQQRVVPTDAEPEPAARPVATRPVVTRPATPRTEPAATPRTEPAATRPTSDVRPRRTVRTRKRTEPKRSEIDRRRVEQRVSTETPDATIAETEGAAAPAATVHVDPPWEGYDKMKAADIVDRVSSADPATKAVVRLYEQTHKKRKSILAATGS